MPPLLGMVMSAHPELIGALSTDLGTEDLWDIIEVMRVDAHNRRIWDKFIADRQGK